MKSAWPRRRFLTASFTFARRGTSWLWAVPNKMTPQAQLAGFLAKLSPEVAALGQKALATLRARFPTANQMVYDNYNALVIGFVPSERPSEAVFSIALSARGAALCFLQCGPSLQDPRNLLIGAGKQTRHLRLESAKMLNDPAVTALLAEATRRAKVPFP